MRQYKFTYVDNIWADNKQEALKNAIQSFIDIHKKGGIESFCKVEQVKKERA